MDISEYKLGLSKTKTGRKKLAVWYDSRLRPATRQKILTTSIHQMSTQRLNGLGKVLPISTAGFQRMDGKNLLGFNDGISNPFRLSNDVIWATYKDEEIEKLHGWNIHGIPKN